MKHNVRQVKQTRTKSVKLKLEHVGNVLERKPVRRGPMGERPFDVVQGEAAIDLRNFVNVFGIVEVDEGKFDCLAEDKPDKRSQTYTNCRDGSVFGDFIAHFANSDPATACDADKEQHLP